MSYNNGYNDGVTGFRICVKRAIEKRFEKACSCNKLKKIIPKNDNVNIVTTCAFCSIKNLILKDLGIAEK